MLSEKPLPVRRRIALVTTGIIAGILFILLLIRYLGPRDRTVTESGSRLKQFFTTLTGTSQAPSNGK